MRRPDGARTTRGFALVDVIVAVVLLGIGIVSLARAVGMLASLTQAAHIDAELRARGESQIERLIAAGYERLSPGEHQQGAYRVRWSTRDGELKQILLVVEHRASTVEAADTLITLLRAP